MSNIKQKNEKIAKYFWKLIETPTSNKTNSPNLFFSYLKTNNETIATWKELKFHSSSEWQEEIIEKIESLGWTVTINKDSCLIEKLFHNRIFVKAESKKLAIFEAIYKFITLNDKLKV